MNRLIPVPAAGIAALGLASASLPSDEPPQADFEFRSDQSAEEIYAGFRATAEDACQYELIDGRATFAVSGAVLEACVLDLLGQAVAAVGREDLVALHHAAVAANPWPQLRR